MKTCTFLIYNSGFPNYAFRTSEEQGQPPSANYPEYRNNITFSVIIRRSESYHG